MSEFNKGYYRRQGRIQGAADEMERIIKLLEPHRITGKSVGGFLGVCSCGESIDDYQLHLIELIKGETNE